jgi:hypothetical protein
VKIDLEEKQRPMSGGHVDIGALFSGRQIWATETGGEWNQQTYLYQDEGIYWFEEYSPAGHNMFIIGKDELREYVVKLLPVLFTPEELKQLMTPAPPAPAQA